MGKAEKTAKPRHRTHTTRDAFKTMENGSKNARAQQSELAGGASTLELLPVLSHRWQTTIRKSKSSDASRTSRPIAATDQTDVRRRRRSKRPLETSPRSVTEAHHNERSFQLHNTQTGYAAGEPDATAKATRETPPQTDRATNRANRPTMLQSSDQFARPRRKQSAHKESLPNG